MEIVFDQSHKAFRYKGKLIQGLLPHLSNTFYPNFDARICLGLGGAIRRPSTALKHGSRVDKEIEKCVRMMRMHCLPLRFFYSRTFRRKYVCPNQLKINILKDSERFFAL